MKHKSLIKLVHGVCGAWFQDNVKNQESTVELTPFLVVAAPYACWVLKTSSDVFVFDLGLRSEGLF